MSIGSRSSSAAHSYAPRVIRVWGVACGCVLGAVAALAQDPEIARHSGRALDTASLAREYGFTDTDGTQPDFPAYWAAELEPEFGPLGAPL